MSSVHFEQRVSGLPTVSSIGLEQLDQCFVTDDGFGSDDDAGSLMILFSLILETPSLVLVRVALQSGLMIACAEQPDRRSFTLMSTCP